MRITNNMMSDSYLSTLNKNLSNMVKYQEQVSSGKAVNSLSDDPVALISIMNCNVKLGKNERYESTVESALTWLEETDTSVYQLNELTQSAYDTLLEVTGDTSTAEDKASAAEYIKQLRDEVLSIANGQSSDKYLFGGYNVNNTPFTLDSSGNILYNGLDLTDATNPDLIAADSESITYEIGVGMTADVSITGTELLGTGEDNAYTLLDNLYNALMSGSSADELGSYITKLQDCQSHMLTVEAKVGGMTNRMELLKDRYEQEDLTYTELKSNTENVDIAEAYTKYSMAMTVYNASLQVGTEIIQCSILDYL
jgi:flagellar hook-associated protein 3 FlgL